MEKISVYRLSDGTLVEDRGEALTKQATINFKKKVKQYCDLSFSSNSGIRDSIEEFILDNTTELYLMLQKYNDECKGI